MTTNKKLLSRHIRLGFDHTNEVIVGCQVKRHEPYEEYNPVIVIHITS